MGDTKGVVKTRMLDDSKLMRKYVITNQSLVLTLIFAAFLFVSMASLELETLRGYNMKPESTFHMSGHLKSSKSHTGLLPPLGGKLPRNLSATLWWPCSRYMVCFSSTWKLYWFRHNQIRHPSLLMIFLYFLKIKPPLVICFVPLWLVFSSASIWSQKSICAYLLAQ